MKTKNLASILAVPVLVFSLISSAVHAQNDPKKNPRSQLKVISVTLEKKPKENSIDSVANVKIRYIKPDGSKAEMIFNNVGYSTSPVNHDKEAKRSGDKH